MFSLPYHRSTTQRFLQGNMDAEAWVRMDVLGAAERGCSFCAVLNTTLELRQLAANDLQEAYAYVHLERLAKSNRISV